MSKLKALQLLLLLFVFLMSAMAGAMISYNPPAAWTRLALIVTGVAAGVLFWRLPDPEQRERGKIPWLRLIFAVLPTMLVSYYALTTEWESRLGKVPWLDPILGVLSIWQIDSPSALLNSNSLGGLLAVLVPLQIGALLHNGRRWRWVGMFLLAVSALGLLLSESRGAWLALAGVSGIWLLYRLSGRIATKWTGPDTRRAQVGLVIGVVGLLLLAVTTAALTPPGQDILKRRNDRLMVWQNSIDLVGDYVFTGIGLGGFEMAYSSYVLLLHVGHTIHAHNLYLDIWLEQGLMGLIAFVGFVSVLILQLLGRLWRGERVTEWQGIAMASVGIILLHGLIDDPFYGYGGYGIVFLFIPLGIMARFVPSPQNGLLQSARFQVIPVALGAIILVSVIGLVPAWRSALFANLGALAQTQAELSAYTWPSWAIQDDMRRSDRIDLGPAIAQYRMALAMDPGNVPANRRLGQIELSRGDYESAELHLQRAFAGAPDQRATRQLLGELYAINGNIDRAVALWKKIDVSNGQLAIRQWWYEHIGEVDHAARMKVAIVARGSSLSTRGLN